MKNGIKKRILSLVLCISMILPMIAQPLPVYSVESEESIAPITNPFTSETLITLPDGSTTTSKSYRIPSMVTLADGTIVAAADIRWNTTYDGGGLDTLVARSTDGGATWNYKVANYLGDNGNVYNASHSTAFLDPSLVVAADGNTVYMLVDLYPYGVALNGKGHTQPSEKVGFNNDGYLLLSGDNHSSYSYYLKDGKIYNTSGTPVEGYKVDAYFNISGPDGIDTNLFCEDSPYKVVRTGYLYLTSTKDGGATWSEPTLLNVKTASERVCLVTPGSSITTSDGTMIFPVYSYHGDNDPSSNTQRLSFIYSNDGVNWSRTEELDHNWASEAAVVELQDGTLRFFVRNGSQCLQYVDYTMGSGWGTVVTMDNVKTNSNTQISAITYSKTSNGKQVVLVSCPTGPSRKGSNSSSASNRLNGSIFVFTVNSSGDMNLENTIQVNENDSQFMYSCLTERSDGSVLILFEDKENGWGVGDNCFYTMDIKGYLPSALGIKLDKPATVIADSNGDAVNSVAIDVYEKTTLKANTYYFTGDVDYQWQIEHGDGKWADIYGENGETLNVTFGLIGTLLGVDGQVGIRCKTTTAVDTVYSQTVNVSIAPYEYEEPEEEPEEEPKVVVSQSVTTSSGKTAVVNIAGDIPEDASIALNEIDPSDIEIAEGEAVALALDISIKNADGTEWQPESGKTVTVTLAAYQLGLTNGDKVAIYHVHNDEVKVLGTYEVTDYTITFEVDGFSEFIFTVAPDDNYDELLGLYAGFNAWNDWTGEGSFAYFWLKSDPADDSEESHEWSIYDEDFEIDQVVKVKDYYIDAERSLWIQVEGVNGLELPKTLQERPWIHMNSLDVYDYEYNTLFFFEPEDTSEEPIAVLDKYGLSVWELYIYSDEKRDITVQTNLSGDVKYRWEVCYDTENLLWTEITGETSATLNLSFGMLSGVLQDGEWAALRCVAYNATESATSNVIIARVILTENMTLSDQPQVIVVTTATEGFAFGRAAAPLMLANSAAPLADDDKVVVTLTAQKEDGTVILQEPYELEYNGTVSRNVEIPYIKGYDLCDEDDNKLNLDEEKNVYTYAVNEMNVTESIEIVLTYKPGKTTYKVTYYQQNVLDEEYTQYGDSVILEGITGETIDVNNAAFSESFDGFYQLLFETAEIASDGSTEIEVFYDRLYYKMLFDLDGGYGVQPVYARYGTPVSVDNPTKAGYIFVGWDYNKGWTEDFVSGEVTEWDLDEDTAADIEQFINVEIPAHHSSYTAIWRANDAAKVTVVVWGQNADDDGYSYVSEETFEIYANTGSTITYVPGQYMCGFEEHTHDSTCSTTCGETEHTHSVDNGCYNRICGKDEHTEHTDSCWSCGGIKNHTLSCYESSKGNLSQTPVDDDTKMSINNNATVTKGGLYKLDSRNSEDRYYFKFGDDYYQVNSSRNNRPDDNTTVSEKEDCGHTNLHTEHDSSCHMTCVEHAHTDTCYELKCTTEVHTHSAACYSCGQKAHTHDASCRHTTSYDNNNLWDLNEAKTGSVTVAADGSTVYNVYYDRTEFTLTFYDSNRQVYQIKERWGKNISSHWPINGTNGTVYNNGERWSPSGSSQFNAVLVFIELMPEESFTLSVSRVNYDEFRMHYMTEVLPGTVGATAYTFNGTTKYFTEAFDTVVANYNYVTKAEDFFDLKGFEQWTSNPKFGSNNQLDINGGGDVYFYYTRSKTQLVFNNYGANTRVEEVFYQAPLSVYGSYKLDDSLAPSVYQEGSVTFKGWYRSPQVPGNFNFENETPFDFATATMPEGDLILYAWWQPVSHNVTFYHSYEDLEAGKVYTVEEITYDYDVPHGSKINYPYTPPADPTNGKYSFNGWFYVNDKGIETLWDFNNSTVTSDVKIYAKWTSNTLMPYTVRFVYKDANGNEVEIADPITGSALAGNTKTFDAKVGSALKSGYQTRYFPEIQSHSLTIDIEDETKNVYTFYYVYRENVPYTVYYLTKDDPDNGLDKVDYDGQTYYQIFAKKEMPDNVNVIVTENAELIGGYVFDEYQKRLYIDPDPNNSSNNVLYFFYEKDTVNGQYIVHYMTEKADGSGFEEHSSFTGKMSSGSVYSVPNPPKEIEHFTWDEGHEDEVMSGTVTAGKILELWVYYVRDEYSYKVQYLDQATGLPVHSEKNGSAKWESQVTEAWEKVDGYELVSNQSYTIDISADPDQNVITFYYVKDVTINYQVVGPADCGAVDPTSETIGAMNGQAGGSTATASSSVYKFVGWYLDADCKNPVPTEWVEASGKITPKKTGELWVNATYYAKFEYNLTSLTIGKVTTDADGNLMDYSTIDPNQSFLFHVTGDGIDLIVTVHGNGSTTINGLKVGSKYTVTELTDWSWRYGFASWSFITDGDTVDSGTANGAAITLGETGNKITFTNERDSEQWLDGDAWVDNRWG